MTSNGRTRAENEQAEAAVAYRSQHPRWRTVLRTKYRLVPRALRALMLGGDRACLCGRGTIIADGACGFCEDDEAALGRQYTPEELKVIRLRSWIEEEAASPRRCP